MITPIESKTHQSHRHLLEVQPTDRQQNRPHQSILVLEYFSEIELKSEKMKLGVRQKNNYSCGEISRKARTMSILETKPINRPFFVINNASSVVNNSLASEMESS